MLLGINHGFMSNAIGDDATIREIKRAGFDGLDYSFDGTFYGPVYFDDYIDMAKHIKKILDEENIVCIQSHCTQTFSHYMERSENCISYKNMVQSIEMCSIIGTDKCVCHAIEAPEGVSYFDYNLDFFGSLEKYARKNGVKILIENSIMPPKHKGEQYPSFFKTPDEMNRFIKEMNSPFVKTVVDVGHANCLGVDPAEYIKSMDNKTLLALHIHDNTGLDYHCTPFDGNINWDSILQALADIDYKGDMDLEIRYPKGLPNELLPYWLKVQEQTGRFLIEEFKKRYIKNLQEIERREAEAKAKAKK